MFAAAPLFAQTADSTPSGVGSLKVAAVPIFFSSPDTRIAIGILPHVLFRTAEETRRSTVKLDAYATQNHQLNLRLGTTIWLPRNTHGIDARLQFQNWPSSFYGMTNSRSEMRKERYTEKVALLSTEVQRQYRPGLYIGLRYDFRYGNITSVEPTGLLAEGSVAGSGGVISSGIGAFVNIDTRDFTVYPTRGVHVRLISRQFIDVNEGAYWFARYRLDAKGYVPLGGRHVLAGQVVLAMAGGDPPFQMMTGVG